LGWLALADMRSHGCLDTLKRTATRAIGTLPKVSAVRKSFTVEPPLASASRC
jgi:hypothetical protein